MKEKENKQQVNKPSEAIEDLTVNEAQAEDVKGGIASFSELAGITTEVNAAKRNPYVTTDYIERMPK